MLTKHQRREARRERRFRRRLMLVALLVMAVSPSFVALYYTAARTHAATSTPKQNVPEAWNHLLQTSSSQDRESSVSDHLPGEGEEEKEEQDSNFGLPQIILAEPSSDEDETHGDDNVHCWTNASQALDVCCAPWSFNTDDWWSQHYDWHEGEENSTHTCFQRRRNATLSSLEQQRSQFLQSLHKFQWGQRDGPADCIQQGGSVDESASLSLKGYATALSSISRAFHTSYEKRVPFQYSAKPNQQHKKKEKRDCYGMACFFLPLGSCPIQAAADQNQVRQAPDAPISNKQEYNWLRQYAFRPRHELRRQRMTWMQQHRPDNLQSPCSTIHVPSRNKEERPLSMGSYVLAGNIQPGATVVVLTDEVDAFKALGLKNRQTLLRRKSSKAPYNWVLLPHTEEIEKEGTMAQAARILARVRLAAECQTLVYNDDNKDESNLVLMLMQQAMLERHADPQSLKFLPTSTFKLW